MMRAVKLLTWLSFSNFLGLNEVRYSKDQKKKSRIWTVLVAYLILGVMLVFYTGLITYALFLFDMNTEYKFKEVLGQNVFGSAEEHAAYIWENDYDEEEKINEYYVSFFIENEEGLYERIEEFHYERAYSMEEIEEGLQAAGMELVEVMDGYSFDAPHEKSERLLFAARLK